MRPICPIRPIATAAILAFGLFTCRSDWVYGGDDTPKPDAAKKPEPSSDFAKTLGEAAKDLKQLALAMHEYHNVYNQFPPAAVRDTNGKLTVSWRVLILPYIKEDALYKQFKLDEPWDSDNNKKLIAKMPAIFRGPNKKLNDEGKTVYLAPVEKNSPFPPDGTRMYFAKITDGIANTIMLVEANDDLAVVWTKPDDLLVDMKKPLTGLIRPRQDVFLVVMCNGDVHRFKNAADPTHLARVFDRQDAQVMDFSKLLEQKSKSTPAKKPTDRPE